MFSTLLAITDLDDSPNPEFWQYASMALIIALTLYTIFATVVSSLWLIRTVKYFRRPAQARFQITDDPMQQIADTRAHLEASKRHLAAVEQRIDELEEQLKRRPLS